MQFRFPLTVLANGMTGSDKNAIRPFAADTLW